MLIWDTQKMEWGISRIHSDRTLWRESIMFFLWRFLQLFRCYRGNQEFVLWIGRFEVTSRRVLTAWMDLFHHDIPEVTTVEFFALLNPAVRQQINDLQDPEEQRQRLTEIREEQINVLRNAHRQQFPLTDNLMSLVFLVQADLNENQRERFVTSMSLRQIDMAQYTYLQVKQLFMELFCTTRTGIADPTIRHVKRSTFSGHRRGRVWWRDRILGSRGRDRRWRVR